MVKVTKLSLGVFDNNCYILSFQGHGVIIDPGAEPEQIFKAIYSLKIDKIIITHGHFDHFGALKEVKSKTGAPVVIHAQDANLLPIPPEERLGDKAIIYCGDKELRVIHTPGHTPGSISILVGDSLFVGDTVFPGGPGKTSSPAAFKRIIQSIEQKILTLPPQTIIYPGHGKETNVAKTKEEYQIFKRRGYPKDLFGEVTW
jgi:glyoxylase-like metal-dependent hydrolase (beta-lactamase superfamily II)